MHILDNIVKHAKFLRADNIDSHLTSRMGRLTESSLDAHIIRYFFSRLLRCGLCGTVYVSTLHAFGVLGTI